MEFLQSHWFEIIIIVGVTWEFNTLKEMLSNIQSDIEELKNRLPEPPYDHGPY